MIKSSDTRPRTFLILQGPPSRFCRHLGDGLRARGHTCLRINLCAADFFMWMGRPAYNYTGKFKHFAGYLEQFVEAHGVTDILYYADRLPYHRVAADVARARGIRTFTYEFGYLRPDWITLECNGMSSQSHFPEDPVHILKAAEGLSEPQTGPFNSFTFQQEALHEVIFHLVNYFVRIPFIHYRRDRYYSELVEYLCYIPKLLTADRRQRRAEATVLRLTQHKVKYFLYAMQMQNDYQLRANSPYRLQETALCEVIASFAANADQKSELVFKVHPLDNGMESWEKIIADAASAHGVGARVHFIEGGDLGALLSGAAGLLMINSTTALQALRLNCPVKVLGMAIYDIRGLTHQGKLDDFWREPTRPDAALRDAFFRLLAATIQVRGNFYNPVARAHAIAEMVDRLEANRVNQPGAYVDPPPRLERARQLGVPFA